MSPSQQESPKISRIAKGIGFGTLGVAIAGLLLYARPAFKEADVQIAKTFYESQATRNADALEKKQAALQNEFADKEKKLRVELSEKLAIASQRAITERSNSTVTIQALTSVISSNQIDMRKMSNAISRFPAKESNAYAKGLEAGSNSAHAQVTSLTNSLIAERDGLQNRVRNLERKAFSVDPTQTNVTLTSTLTPLERDFYRSMYLDPSLREQFDNNIFHVVDTPEQKYVLRWARTQKTSPAVEGVRGPQQRFTFYFDLEVSKSNLLAEIHTYLLNGKFIAPDVPRIQDVSSRLAPVKSVFFGPTNNLYVTDFSAERTMQRIVDKKPILTLTNDSMITPFAVDATNEMRNFIRHLGSNKYELEEK